ncbi:helix-turn-helix domain-containing protein [Photobacterium atrarenae]|uniref:Helix-turn-helix domain-containing protein n=1 Tax=Photobacterium atrarenae TaxID=865757 RepID=A0ABY5GMW6_9GAMM|nr:helix-turn-helix domain-containing protein [Photobacterium atrarenae]UTV30668.1 helix-turn-helix domain-containing protein [Photobacterium atrarenae]
MNTWKHPPANPALAPLIDSYWLLEYCHDDADRPQPLLIPNPSCHLILTPPAEIHHYQLPGQDGGQDSTVVGPHLLTPFTQALTIRDNPQVLRLGVKFQPGAQYRLMGLNGKAQTNQIIGQPATKYPALDALIQPETLSELLSQRDHPEAVVAELDRHFTALLTGSPDDRHSRLVQQALRLLVPTIDHRDESRPSCELAQMLGCSQRTLERAFIRVTGLTMKQYLMMQRLDELFLYLYRHPDHPPDWTDIAARFGFSDQPHLSRQLRRAIGATPGHYLDARNLIIDIYGDFGIEDE